MNQPRRRILLVDDEPLIVRTVGTQLEAAGFDVMTAKGELVDQKACEGCGADAFLSKPCRIEDILKQVRALLP